MKQRSSQPIAPLGGLDYLAKDYASFLQLMYDVMAKEVPAWQERNPADLGVTVMEALAYAADHLSYRQDAIANEAYIDTARNRVSVARHLRLLSYRLHQGCNARVWLSFTLGGKVERGFVLPRGSRVSSRSVGDPSTGTHEAMPDAFDTAPPAPDRNLLMLNDALLDPIRDDPLQHSDPSAERVRVEGAGARPPDALVSVPSTPGSVFQTLSDARLDPALDELRLDPGSVADGVLPEGCERIVIGGHVHALKRGDVILIQWWQAGAVPVHRHLARIRRSPRYMGSPRDLSATTELLLESDDALPFPIRVDPGRGVDSSPHVTLHGNMVLAEHGSRVHERLGRFGERSAALTLGHRDILWGEPYDPRLAHGHGAATCLRQDPARAVPRLYLLEPGGDTSPARRWSARRDLVDCGPADRVFAIDAAGDGTSRIRFGDGVHGRRPPHGAELEAVYLIGDGSNGRVGSDTLTRLDLAAIPDLDPPRAASIAVCNPLPSHGEIPPEPAARAKSLASHVARQPRGLVTPEDCAAYALQFDSVVRTLARRRWTGSWSTDMVFVQRSNALPVDARFRSRLEKHLAPRLLAGREVEIREARWIGIDLAIHVRLAARRSPDAVRQAVQHNLLGEPDGGGSGALFHPDNFGFGDVLHLDTILDRVMSVPGVSFAEARHFTVWDPTRSVDGGGPDQVLDDIDPGAGAIVRLAAERGRPELGRLDLFVEGQDQ